ncbi:putative integral membrane protein [Cylindrospermum stagnale PCC 7417]|uniref:Putative integral membrane protein n=1 Tax=Cylindrospermum stagnale PCC 7417 TaxID=56107 RepID=K9WTQ7_9NOST|nr:VanZ family protein [Cylindrospermum stagnale]AFZ23184.1 putative integral membrane protein [Cylindrospermum stagnale PCC 7417]
MNRRKIITQIFNLHKTVLMINLIVVIISILLVLIATLYPFNFSFPESLSLQAIIASFDNASSFNDLVNNILLFMPFGFSFTAFLQRIRMKLKIKLLIVIFVSTGISSIVEILQVFLPSRLPTPADIVNNTIGGIVGIICFYIWSSQSFLYILTCIENTRTSSSIQKITLLFIGYIFLSFLISINWQTATNLNNWSLKYPLLLGNEQTGDRPWQGYILEVNIADRAISKNEVLKLFNTRNYLDNNRSSLIASYQLTGKEKFQDRTGTLTELLPQGTFPKIEDVKGVALSSKHWLKTADSATSLNRRIRETSQFTISTIVATTNTAQTGPARIISLSGNLLRRNFTLGQQETNLELRLRTPITGENAADFKFTIPDIFTDTDQHHIVITYFKATLQVYVDKLENYYSLNLLDLIPKKQNFFYYGLNFIPLGLCLMLLTTLAKKQLSFYRLLLPSGILLPSLILESILVSDSGKSISLKNLLLGIFFTGGTMLLLRLRASALVKKAGLN